MGGKGGNGGGGVSHGARNLGIDLPHQGYDAPADEIARVRRVLVGGVRAVGKSVFGKICEDILSRAVDQRPHDGKPMQRALRWDARNPCRARAAAKMKNDGL